MRHINSSARMLGYVIVYALIVAFVAAALFLWSYL